MFRLAIMKWEFMKKDQENTGCVSKNSNLTNYMKYHTIKFRLDYEGTKGH